MTDSNGRSSLRRQRLLVAAATLSLLLIGAGLAFAGGGLGSSERVVAPIYSDRPVAGPATAVVAVVSAPATEAAGTDEAKDEQRTKEPEASVVQQPATRPRASRPSQPSQPSGTKSEQDEGDEDDHETVTSEVRDEGDDESDSKDDEHDESDDDETEESDKPDRGKD